MKKWFDFLATIWLGIATHKLRSFLTILGIVIGVGAVITMMSIGKGAEASILSRIQGLGSNLVTISPGVTTGAGGVRAEFGSSQTLTLEDAEAMAQEVAGIAAVAPTYSASFQIIAGSQNVRSRVSGVTADYMQVYNLKTVSGDFFSDEDYQRGAKMALLGSTVSSTLFQGEDPVGQRIRVGSYIVTVVGVLESKGAGMGSMDDIVLVPMTALQQMSAQQRTSTGGHIVSSIALTVADQEQSATVVENIKSLLRARHDIAVGADDDFRLTSMEELSSALSATMGTMTLLLGAIAAISLLVGGIGVMNIMLVSVLERTREIGIRKALGAREQDIWVQFLIEAALLTFTGGLIGIAMGWGASLVVSRMASLTTLVSADIVILAAAVSIAIGLFFGFYPAWNASHLDPIQALRSE